MEGRESSTGVESGCLHEFVEDFKVCLSLDEEENLVLQLEENTKSVMLVFDEQGFDEEQGREFHRCGRWLPA